MQSNGMRLIEAREPPASGAKVKAQRGTRRETRATYVGNTRAWRSFLMRDGIVMGQPAVWIFDEERGEKTNGWCVLRMRLQACSGAERQNGM